MNAQTTLVLCWSMLLAGAGLTGFGLFRALSRLRAPSTAPPDGEGEIMIGDGGLKVGQRVSLEAGSARESGPAAGSRSGTIVSFRAGRCEIEIDGAPAPGSIAPGSSSAGRLPEGDGGAAGETWLQPRASLLVTVVSRAELYRFRSRLLESRRTERGLTVVVARPSILSRIQRRHHARVRLNAPATFEPVIAATPGPKGERGEVPGPVHGTLRDISGGGLRAHVGGVGSLRELDRLLALFRPETIVRIKLPIPALPGEGVAARIVSCSRAVAQGGLTAQVTCEFLPMPAWEREIVIGRVFEFQRDQARAGEMSPRDGQSRFRQ